MNRNVSIYIEGIVRDEDESRIATNAIGEWRQLDGVHILRYEESAVEMGENSEDNDSLYEDCVNTIKISPGRVEMIKSGESSTHMVFDLTQDTESLYETPYGCLRFQVNTSKINLEEKQNKLILNMEYSLSHNNSHISDNHINIVVRTL